MLILAVETATRAGSLAMIDADRRVVRAEGSTRTHSERLPRELFDFAAAQGRSVRDADFLAVVTGPGSFTGLRIGLAAVQGIALVNGQRVIPVSTFDALRMVWADARSPRGVRLGVCLDGARGDVFFAVFDFAADAGAAPTVRLPPAVGTPAEAASAIGSTGSGLPLVLAGDGATRYRAEFSAALPGATVEEDVWNLALGAALAARERTQDAVAPHALRPLYVRRPDAVLARERTQTIARATLPQDLAAVAELQRRSFANAWGAEAIRWELDNSDVARLYVVRGPDDSLIAYCACWVVFDELHINSVAVDESRRRQGTALRLLRYVLADAASTGTRSATLEVRQSNASARGLYERLGFKVEGVRRNYYENPREDALILWHRDVAGQFGGIR